MRRTILIGFGLVIALWVVSTYDLVYRMNDLQQHASDVNQRYIRSERLLTRVRFNVLYSSIAFRDALLDTAALERRQREIIAARRSAEEAMRDYLPVVGAPEGERNFNSLSTELEAFWQGILPVFEWDHERRAAEALSILRQSINPKREHILSISDTVRQLNRESYARQQAQIADLYRRSRIRIVVTSGVLLALSVGVAAIVLVQTGRLERALRVEMERDAENRLALRRLSERLVHAQEEERRAIARELHDEIGQALTAIKMELSVAERGSAGSDALDGNRLGEARSITDRALNAVRDLSKLLHPPLLDDMGLLATLDWYLGAFSRRTGIRTELLREGIDERMSPNVETHAYRIVQEALTNVARHARATKCSVKVRRLSGTVRVEVADDGIGFDTQAGKVKAGGGLGLLGIAERVETLGGTFELESSPGEGTRLVVELPVRRGVEVSGPSKALDLMAAPGGRLPGAGVET